MMAVDRRTLLAAGTVAAAATALPAAEPLPARPVAGFTPQPLPFDAAGLPGLSGRLLTSHHQNNYGGAVRRLNAIRQQQAGQDPARQPGFALNGIKREELIAWNSMILHEIHFAGLGLPVPPEPALASAIERDFGSHARWQAEFAAMGKALGGGSGWVLLSWSAHDRCLVNTWAADHGMGLAGATPLIALDMYEHAYAMDYGANAGAYVDVFMGLIDWRRASRQYGILSA